MLTNFKQRTYEEEIRYRNMPLWIRELVGGFE